jgi:hypothetical protein
MGRVSYSAVVLDEESRTRLINFMNAKNLIPEGWEILAHHMTINMGELSSENKKNIGMSIELTANDVAEDDKVIAVGVSGFPSNNPKSHITVAVNRANGGKPQMSNNLTDWKRISVPIQLRGVITEVQYKI